MLAANSRFRFTHFDDEDGNIISGKKRTSSSLKDIKNELATRSSSHNHNMLGSYFVSLQASGS
jgi:hypothetical protein